MIHLVALKKKHKSNICLQLILLHKSYICHNMSEMANDDACEIGLAIHFKKTNQINEFSQQLVQYNSQQHEQYQVNWKPKICSGGFATAVLDDSIDNHNTSQELNKKDLLTFGSASTQRMGHCIRHRCEQKTKVSIFTKFSRSLSHSKKKKKKISTKVTLN